MSSSSSGPIPAPPAQLNSQLSGSGAQQGIFISAPGKIILFGEHAVVYGRTAVAGSIDLRTFVSLFTSADGRIYLSLPDLGVEKTWMLKDLHKAVEKLGGVEDGVPPSLETIVPLARKLSGSCEEQCGVQHLAILAFWYILLGVAQRKRDLLAVKVTVRFKLPSCVGLGSSGAYCVCIAAALLQSVGLIPSPPNAISSCQADEVGYTWDDCHLDTIRRWAASAESLIHGRASGLDAAVCTYGGVASFKPGTRIQHLRKYGNENLPELRVILVNSKVERNTSRMVATVKEKLKKFPDVVDAIFNSIDAIAKESVKILNRPPGDTSLWNSEANVNGASSSASSTSTAGHNSTGGGGPNACSEDEHSALQEAQYQETFIRLNDLCRMNNQLLIALGVGHPKVDQICTLLARYGIHPKMTGAGGGGSVFAFLKPGTADTSATVMDMIKHEITKLGYEIWQPPLGGHGVYMHSEKPEIFQQHPPRT